METGANSETLYRILEKEIIDLQLRPGAQLSENDLCARFGVSRTPVRSVLQRLQENGLVTITPYKSTTVTLLNFDIVNQIIYQRMAVEYMVLRDFMHVCSPLMLEKLRHNIQLTRELISAPCDVNDFFALDSAFHATWFAEMHKMFLWDNFQKAQCNYSRFRMLDIVEVQNMREITDEHDQFLQALEQKDESALEPLLQKHLYGGVRRLGGRIYTDLAGYFEDTE